jgi:hypothetical protein
MAGKLGGLMSGIGAISAAGSQATQIGVASAVNQAQSAVQLAQLEAEGTAAQMQLNQVFSAANIQTDLEGMAMKQGLLMASKALETSTLIAQYREKTLGLFNTITEQRTGNVWQRIKQASQGFKF